MVDRLTLTTKPHAIEGGAKVVRWTVLRAVDRRPQELRGLRVYFRIVPYQFGR
jgi:hypothetical protein